MKEAPTEATLYRNKAAAIKATESALKAIATVVDMESFMTVLLSRAGAQLAFSSPMLGHRYLKPNQPNCP
jgi:hypothetical protein